MTQFPWNVNELDPNLYKDFGYIIINKQIF